MSDPYPLYLPSEARRLFQTESLLRRLAQAGQWDDTSRLLELFGSVAGLSLSRALDCELTVVDPSAKTLGSLADRAKVAGLTDRVTFTTGDVRALELPEGSFTGIFSLGRITGPLAAEAKRLRPLLVEQGRLGLTTVVKVSRHPNAEVLKYWEGRLEAPLLMPREALMALEAHGFEPELIDSVGDEELEAYYGELLQLLEGNSDEGAEALRAEIAMSQAHPHGGVSWAFVVGRRKEPGEKPPMSRDSG